MWISDTSIKRPVFATMFIASFLVLGVVSMTRLGVDLFPEVSFPFVNIATVYPGASPEEVETLVTKPIEDAVAGIEGVKRVESNSNESFSRVGIEFNLDVDAQGAAAEVREKVSAIRFKLPREIDDPTISRFDVAALPIATYAVSSLLPADRTRLIVEDSVKPLLQQIEGVAAVEVNGGLVREVQVNLDPRRLEALQLPVAAVAEALAAANVDLPGGKVTAKVYLRNDGMRPLDILSVTASPGLTLASEYPKNLQSQAMAVISVTEPLNEDLLQQLHNVPPVHQVTQIEL